MKCQKFLHFCEALSFYEKYPKKHFHQNFISTLFFNAKHGGYVKMLLPKLSIVDLLKLCFLGEMMNSNKMEYVHYIFQHLILNIHWITY